MNQEIKKTIKAAGLRQWQVAKKLNVAESTFVRWLRDDLSPERKESICNAIADLQREGRSA